jgi:hypothetical protein
MTNAKIQINSFFLNVSKNLKIIVPASLITAWFVAGTIIFKACVITIYYPDLTNGLLDAVANCKVAYLFIFCLPIFFTIFSFVAQLNKPGEKIYGE